MGPAEAPSSPAFPALEPIIMDDEMEQSYQDANLDFLDPSRLQMSAEDTAREFDDLFTRGPVSGTIASSEVNCLSPSRLSLGKHFGEGETLRAPHVVASDSSADSPDNSSRSSSSESPSNHLRNSSVASSANSAIHSDHTMIAQGLSPEDWMSPHFANLKDDALFGLNSTFPVVDGRFLADGDIESSNKAMDAAFDFESAASSPSPLNQGASLQAKSKMKSRSQSRNPSHKRGQSASSNTVINGVTNGSYERQVLREASPLSMSTHPAQRELSSSHWAGQSPSSVLEDFGGITMNGGSPMNNAVSPGVQGRNDFNFGLNFPASSSASRAGSRPQNPQRHVLKVHPTSLKSRVETQIPIKLTLYPLPAGAKKIRLPTHTISKPKFLAPPDAERSPDVLELHTSLVCTSAMHDPDKMKRAFARARGEIVARRPSANSVGAEDCGEEDTPLEGGEVHICGGCIQRERKRASRKKMRKPEDDQLFQKDEEKRVIVFNTNEIKEWAEPPPPNPECPGDASPGMPAGAMQVELPMRIACYCRHQSEKLGFQVIFTVKDYKGHVIAQAITNSIMITDDHKTHGSAAVAAAAAAAAAANGTTSSVHNGPQMPGAGTFTAGSASEAAKATSNPPQGFRHSLSTTDLQDLQQRLSPPCPPGPGSVAASPNGSGALSSSRSPRNLSRQASPVEFPAPSSKRRKHSNSNKLPSELTMTRLETMQQTSGIPPSAASLNGSARGFTSPPIERPFVTVGAMSGPFGTGPPTPSGPDINSFFNPAVQPQTLESLVQQQLMSAPNSAHPSRPGTPGGTPRNAFQDQNLNPTLNPASTSALWPPLTGTGNRMPSVIHKLVPAEGSITGGTEVTLLGSGFYPGMEVVFGDTLATTTTFWGDKCLNCLTPPALQPGLVAVVFKHEHPTFGPVQQSQPLLPKQQQFFRYVDDRELQMYRLALGILGQKLGNKADAFHTAQQIMGADPNAVYNLQKDYQGGSGGHQRQVPGLDTQGKMSDLDSKMLTYLEFIDLDDNPRPPRYNACSSTGLTLLHFAASLGLTRFVAGLLARGASPDEQDKNGNTPMHLAALNGHAHIVHRLRLAGADGHARSIRGFAPADLATSLAAHQAALIPSAHHRSRSVGSLTSARRRYGSSTSLTSFWEASSGSGSLDYDLDDSDESDMDESDEDAEDIVTSSGFHVSTSRRSSMHHDAAALGMYPLSRQNSVQPMQLSLEQTPVPDDARIFSPPASLIAWRNHLAGQINQFQQSVANAFPNLPALPPIPALPDYQAHPMMRRITNLVPHRPATAGAAKEGWWDLLTGGSATPSVQEPPSYEELYPHQECDADALTTKKNSLLRAATDAAVDLHFESQSSSSKMTAEEEEIKDITIGRNSISREQQKQLREQQARRMKGLRKDRNLYFVWIPLLLLVVCAWVRSYVPGIWQGFSEGLGFVKSRYVQRAQEIPA